VKKRSGTSKGRKYHSWWPPLFTAADEHQCKRCGMRIKQVQRKAELVVWFPEHTNDWRIPCSLSRAALAIVYYVKFPGIRRWIPRLPNQLIDCERSKKGFISL
jgi:hypothetical protein